MGDDLGPGDLQALKLASPTVRYAITTAAVDAVLPDLPENEPLVPKYLAIFRDRAPFPDEGPDEDDNEFFVLTFAYEERADDLGTPQARRVWLAMDTLCWAAMIADNLEHDASPHPSPEQALEKALDALRDEPERRAALLADVRARLGRDGRAP